MALEGKATILLTFDVEDWFQVENFKDVIPYSSWDRLDLRVRRNTHRILDLLDSFPFGVRATFFILGWVAEKCPDLVREIHSRGHEVASHGYGHHLCSQLPPHELARDLRESKQLLEDLLGEEILGYRAPSFSISKASLELVKSAGYQYDSSYNSFSGHGRYGALDLDGYPGTGGVVRIKDTFFEIPVSNLKLGRRIFPLGGGGYFRLFPLPLFKLAMKQVIARDNAFVFYSHPWEFDPDQPRVEKVSPWLRFRHYVHLEQTERKLERLIRTFSHLCFSTMGQHLKGLGH